MNHTENQRQEPVELIGDHSRTKTDLGPALLLEGVMNKAEGLNRLKVVCYASEVRFVRLS